MASLEEIDRLTKQYADVRDLLADKVNALQDELEQLKRQKLPGIKNTLAKAAEAQALLKSAIEAGQDLFVKPRTIILHGVRVGLQKGKGTLAWEDQEQVIKLIKKRFPDQAEVLIRTTEKPNKKTLDELSVEDLKKIGITVEETGDVVVIKPVTDDVDKLVAAILKEATEDEEAA